MQISAPHRRFLRLSFFSVGIRSLAIGLLLIDIGTAPAQAGVELEVVPLTAAHRHAAQVYRSIWEEFGQQIVAALEARTCLSFQEPQVSAVIADAVSHSGGPDHPMRLRATYPDDIKRATLVHELGHRHLWQLTQRLADIDGHRTLYLVLDRVWADVWGEQFAASRIATESSWKADYDYAAAWAWVRSLDPAERERLWRELLRMNGYGDGAGCDADPGVGVQQLTAGG